MYNDDIIKYYKKINQERKYCKTEVGYMIRSARKQKQLSIETVSKALKVSRSAIQHWEHGRRVPSAYNALQLSIMFDIPLEKLCARSNRELLKPAPNVAGTKIFFI